MFNRYVPGGFDLPPPPEEQPAPPPPAEPVFADVTAEEPAAEGDKKGLIGSLKSLFGSNVKLPDMNADTVLLLVMVYFLVADDKENISDTLLIIGVLLLLGF